MTCDRHAYFKRNPRGFANEYTIRVLPEASNPPEPSEKHNADTQPWQRISASEARHEAAWEHEHGPDNVTVEKCPICYTAGTLENDAERHPNGTLAQRLNMAGPAPTDETTRRDR